MDIILNPKTEGGKQIIQLERAAGAVRSLLFSLRSSLVYICSKFLFRAMRSAFV
jgi:hypothetical protein